MLTFGLLLAVGCLYGVEKAAERIEIEATLNPQEIPASVQPHPYLLWELPPGDTVVNGQNVHINAVGSRGPETTWKKALGTRRVMAVGDGVAFGEGVERATTFIVDAVNALGGTRVGVETLLLAAPDYSIVQQRNLMDMRGWSLEPNLLIVSGPGADMTVKTYVDEEIIAEFQSLNPQRANLEQLATFRILNHHMQVISGPTALKRGQVFNGQVNTNTIGRPRVSVNDYAKHLDALTASAIDRGIALVFVLYPVPADLNDSHLTNRVSLYRTAMTDVAVRHGVPIVDGPKEFIKSGRSKERLFMNGRLLSEYGHRTLSYALARTLRRWMRGRSILSQGTGADIPHYTEPDLLPDVTP